MDSAPAGTVGHFRERVGGLLESEPGEKRDLPVLLEPVLGGPRWRYEDAGLSGDGDRGSRALVFRGGQMLRPTVRDGYPNTDACIEQVRRSLAVGDRCAAVTWAQRLTVLLMASAGGDPLWSPRHG